MHISCLFQTFLRLLKKLHFWICHICALVFCASRCKKFGRNKKQMHGEDCCHTWFVSCCCCRPPRTPAASRHSRVPCPSISTAGTSMDFIFACAHTNTPHRHDGKRWGGARLLLRASALAAATFVWFGGEAGKKAKRGGPGGGLLLYQYLVVSLRADTVTNWFCDTHSESWWQCDPKAQKLKPKNCNNVVVMLVIVVPWYK